MALLFAQLATAAYACPKGVTSAQTSVVMADMPGCDGSMSRAMDLEQPQLCKAHCEQGSQSVHPAASSNTPSPPVLLAVLDWALVPLIHSLMVRRADSVSSGAPPPGSLPLYLSLLVLRN